jgi:hypothetical protein
MFVFKTLFSRILSWNDRKKYKNIKITYLFHCPFSRKRLIKSKQIHFYMFLLGKSFPRVASLATYGELWLDIYCSISIAHAQDLDSIFLLDEYCQRELVFWRDNAKKLNIKYIHNNATKKSNYVIYFLSVKMKQSDWLRSLSERAGFLHQNTKMNCIKP